MRARKDRLLLWSIPLLLASAWATACGGSAAPGSPAAAATAAAPAASTAPAPTPAAGADPQAAAQAAPAASATGGFDGQRAYQYVADVVAIGPRSAGTEGSKRTQKYITDKLHSFGCQVDAEPFHSGTPIGDVSMTNLVVKIPGAKPDIVMLTGHYDTKLIPNFVGADDAGSSTGVILEMARLLCQRKNALTYWLVFFDGEEAFNPDWQDPDNTYGSRELAARMALSGDLKRTKAMILVDMVGEKKLRLLRESMSTPWLVDMLWSTAARLGYGDIFVRQESAIDDDHLAFVRRRVASADIIDLATPQELNYWHTTGDTLDKVSAHSLAVVGHVLIATVAELEQKFGGGR